MMTMMAVGNTVFGIFTEYRSIVRIIFSHLYFQLLVFSPFPYFISSSNDVNFYAVVMLQLQ